MDDKQIDLKKPLISVRRHSGKGASVTHDRQESPLVLPRLPYYISDLKSGPISDPGAVPFQWEHKPGKPKAEIKPELRMAPKLPPGRFIAEFPCGSVKSPSPSEEIDDFEKLRRETEGSKSSSDCDDEYADAPDRLSWTESSYLNCGMSDFSDLDENLSQKFPAGPHANEFMMKRFIPAAKAIASETPTYLPPKQSLAREKPLQVKQGFFGKPELRYGPSFAKKYSHFGLDAAIEEEEDDEDDDEKECDFNGSFPGVCGLFSNLCLKSPFYLQNHVPSLNLRSRASLSSATKTPPEKDSDSSDSVVEKTVLVDTLQKVSNLSSPSSPENEHEITSRIMNQMHETDSPMDDSIIDEEWERTEQQLISTIQKKTTFPAYSHMKHLEVTLSLSADDVEKHLQRARTRDNLRRKSSERPLPPPLPKSPSDSWLCRALPSLSASAPQKNFSKPVLVPAASPQKLSFTSNWNSSKEKLMSIPECDEDHYSSSVHS